jgi:hypothetical protein
MRLFVSLSSLFAGEVRLAVSALTALPMSTDP